jgi:hypothetical protein
MWWVLPGFVAGLIASSFMIFCWFYRLRSAMAERGWMYTSRLWVVVWIAAFFGSASGLFRMATVIQEGSIIDNMLSYASATLYWIALGRRNDIRCRSKTQKYPTQGNITIFC